MIAFPHQTVSDSESEDGSDFVVVVAVVVAAITLIVVLLKSYKVWNITYTLDYLLIFSITAIVLIPSQLWYEFQFTEKQ